MLSDTRRWSEKFVIKHPWHDVVSSVQFKYPNPYNPNVLNIDVINRQVDLTGGAMLSCKLINSSWPMFHMGHLKALEYSCIQVPNKRMVSNTKNIDFRSIISYSDEKWSAIYFIYGTLIGPDSTTSGIFVSHLVLV
ncbi:unnamed protein product [Schistosoma haematobium]|nr:unnamed protein product [Schistosoma haematobium]